MKKRIAFSCFMLLLVNVSFCQVLQFPSGVYLTHDELKEGKPNNQIKLKILARSSGKKFWSGGNDYKIEAHDSIPIKGFSLNSIYAYAQNDSLFINCKIHSLGEGYSLALTKGNFIAFNSALSTSKKNGAAIMGGLMGALATSGNDYLHVLSLRTGNVRELNSEYIKGRLKEHKELLQAYEDEEVLTSKKTLLKYINELNKITDSKSVVPVNK